MRRKRVSTRKRPGKAKRARLRGVRGAEVPPSSFPIPDVLRNMGITPGNVLLSAGLGALASVMRKSGEGRDDRLKSRLVRILALAHGDAREPRALDKIAALAQEALGELGWKGIAPAGVEIPGSCERCDGMHATEECAAGNQLDRLRSEGRIVP